MRSIKLVLLKLADEEHHPREARTPKRRRKKINYTIICLSLILYALFLSRFVRFKWAF